MTGIDMRKLNRVESLLTKISIAVSENANATKKAREEIEKKSKEDERNSAGLLKNLSIWGKWHRQLTSTADDVKLFGFHAASVRRIMYGFLPPGMFRAVNKLASTFKALDWATRKFNGTAEEGDKKLEEQGNILINAGKIWRKTFGFRFKLLSQYSKAEKEAHKINAKMDKRKLKDDIRMMERRLHLNKWSIEEKLNDIEDGLKKEELAKSRQQKFDENKAGVASLDVRIHQAQQKAMLEDKDILKNKEANKVVGGDLLAAKLKTEQYKLAKFLNSMKMAIKSVFRGIGMGILYLGMIIAMVAIFVKVVLPAIMRFKEQIGKFMAPILKVISLIWEYILWGFDLIWNGLFGDGTIGDVLKGLLVVVSGLFFMALAGIIALGSWLLALSVAFVVGIWNDFLDWVSDSGSWQEQIWKVSMAFFSILGMILLAVGSNSPIYMILAFGVLIWAAMDWFAKKMDFFAAGGVSTGGLAVVGEKGPELVNLPSGSRVHSNADSKKLVSGGGSNTINITINARDTSDSELRRIADKIGNMVNNKINRSTSSGTMR